MTRFEDKPKEYDFYSKIYIRADLKRTVIKRKYQKFMEFYADASSLLIAIYAILDIIFNYVNTFYAHHSLSKSIFFFKDLEEENSFNIFKKREKIQDLLYMTDLNQSKNNSIDFESKDSKNSKYFSNNNKDSERLNILENNKEDYQREIRIYNNKKNQTNNKNIKCDKKFNDYNVKLDIEKLKANKIFKTKNNNGNTLKGLHNYTFKKKEDDNYPELSKKDFINNKQGETVKYFKKREKDNESSRSQGTNMDDISSESSSVKKKVIKAYNSFNIFKIIITEFFKCCRSDEMIIKSDVNEKAKNILFKKMDINTYVRNMILFDMLNQLILDDSKKTIINFLCRPVISLNNNQNIEINEFYKNYKEKDFKKFYQEILDLSQKQNKDDKDNKLISASNEHLKLFV